jgi:DNA-binding MarR family transcriptional regulator
VVTPQSVEADLGWALGAVMRTYRRLAEHLLAELPGGPRGYQVLSAVARGEQANQLALAQCLGVDRTVMTYLLDDLENAGLVERRPDPADRRARRIALTEQGRARLCAFERALRDAEELHLLGPLDPAERDTFRELLHRLATRSAANEPLTCVDVEAEPATAPPRRRRR